MTDKLTTTATRTYYADAISDAIADAEAVLGTLIVTRIECVTADPEITGARSSVRAPYTATVETTKADR
jgi:hypothetical protein